MSNGLRASELIQRLVETSLTVGDNPVYITDDDGVTYRLVDIITSNGDLEILIELEHPELHLKNFMEGDES